jgi:hypothetical protein
MGGWGSWLAKGITTSIPLRQITLLTEKKHLKLLIDVFLKVQLSSEKV